MSMCRACLVLLTEEDVMHNLIEDKDLAVKFMQCTTIIVLGAEEDDMPKYLCESCHNLLQKFYNFQCMCLESLMNFKRLLQDIQTQIDKQEANKLLKDDKLEPATAEIEQVYIVDNKAAVVESVEDVIVPEKISKNLLRKTKVGKLNCSICKRRFNKFALFEAHMLKHRGEEPYTCMICNKHYSYERTLNEHLTDVHTITAYFCNYPNCTKVYKTERGRNYHFRTEHDKTSIKNDSKTVYTCEECGKSFKGRMPFERHSYVHLPKSKRPYGCNECEQRFYTRGSLLNHLNRHAGIKAYKCKECGKSLGSQSALIAHINTHTKRRSWQCKDCDRVFNNPSNFRHHKRVVHEGIKKFVCGTCSQPFAKRDHLRNHEMRHTGERPYQCKVCPKSFIQKNALKLHTQRMHPRKKYKVLQDKNINSSNYDFEE